jgi:transposase
VVDRHRARVRAALEAAPLAGSAETDVIPAPTPAPPATRLGRNRHDRLAAPGARFDRALELRGRGLPLDGTAAATGLARSAVERWPRRGTVPTWREPRRAGVLDAHRDHLERRWREGCRNASALWRELRARGLTGRPGIVGRRAARARRGEDAAGRRPSPPRGPSGRRPARLLTTGPEGLGPDDRRLAALVRAAAPELAEAADLAVAFAGMVRDKDASRLDGWLDAAAASGLAPLARGVRQGLPAVRAALELPWSTSPVEGQINRLKTLKRQMYGRAKLDLLGRRFLLAA